MYPTLLDLCGVPRPDGPPIDGLSLRPLLEGTPARLARPHAVHPSRDRREAFGRVPGHGPDPAFQPGERRGTVRDSDRPRREERTWRRSTRRRSRNCARPTRPGTPQAARECGFTRKPIPVGYAEENPVVLPAPQSYFERRAALPQPERLRARLDRRLEPRRRCRLLGDRRGRGREPTKSRWPTPARRPILAPVSAVTRRRRGVDGQDRNRDPHGFPAQPQPRWTIRTTSIWPGAICASGGRVCRRGARGSP